MNSKNQKILNLIKSDYEIGNYVFGYSDTTEEYKENNFKDIILEELTPPNVIWLYLTYFDGSLPSFVGIEKGTDDIYTVLDGDSYILCEGLENLPYEILRLKASYADNETVVEVFNDDPELKIALERYEQWCKDNGIELDKNKIYHDENGNLFTKYFELN